MPAEPTLIELTLQPEINGIGKKCYAIANVTKETGEFPNKRYFTSERLRYIGLHTRSEQVEYAFRWYFQHPITQEESFIELKNPFFQLNSPNSSPAQKVGFVEVKCHGNRIRSLQDLSRGLVQNYIKSQSINNQQDIVESLKNQGIYDIIDVSENKRSKGGGKRKKTIKKRYKQKNRKNRGRSVRR